MRELPALRRALRRTRAAELPWNFPLHLNNLGRILDNFPGERLASHAGAFGKFVRKHEQLFKEWLFSNQPTHRTMADSFIAFLINYGSAESVRKAASNLSTSVRKRS